MCDPTHTPTNFYLLTFDSNINCPAKSWTKAVLSHDVAHDTYRQGGCFLKTGHKQALLETLVDIRGHHLDDVLFQIWTFRGSIEICALKWNCQGLKWSMPITWKLTHGIGHLMEGVEYFLQYESRTSSPSASLLPERKSGVSSRIPPLVEAGRLPYLNNYCLL